MRKSSTKLYHWALEKANSSKAPFWLFVLFSLEILLLIPLDAVMMFFCSQKRGNIFLYIFLATIASTISGAVGYLLGHFLWDLIGNFVVPHLVSAASFAKVSSHLNDYEVWAVFFGGLIPFPLKALSLAAGVFQLGLLPFITYLTLARLVRFTIIGSLMAIWGDKLKAFVDRHFHKVFVVLSAKIAGAILFFWVLAK